MSRPALGSVTRLNHGRAVGGNVDLEVVKFHHQAVQILGGIDVEQVQAEIIDGCIVEGKVHGLAEGQLNVVPARLGNGGKDLARPVEHLRLGRTRGGQIHGRNIGRAEQLRVGNIHIKAQGVGTGDIDPSKCRLKGNGGVTLLGHIKGECHAGIALRFIRRIQRNLGLRFPHVDRLAGKQRD